MGGTAWRDVLKTLLDWFSYLLSIIKYVCTNRYLNFWHLNYLYFINSNINPFSKRNTKEHQKRSWKQGFKKNTEKQEIIICIILPLLNICFSTSSIEKMDIDIFRQANYTFQFIY